MWLSGSAEQPLSKREHDEIERLKQPSSPRRPRAAEHDFGHKATFFPVPPELVLHKAERKGQEQAFPYAKRHGTDVRSLTLRSALWASR